MNSDSFDTNESEVQAEEAKRLRSHVRALHPNLLGGGPDQLIAFSPLPESGLSRVPFMWLHAIHEASHAGQWRNHDVDYWQACPEDIRGGCPEDIRGDVGGPGDPTGQERVDYEERCRRDWWLGWWGDA